MITSLRIQLPRWVSAEILRARTCDTDTKKISLAVRLSAKNVEQKTGGPFGAAVFARGGELVSAGVNCVVGQHCFAAHAEVMALMLAQRRLRVSRLCDAPGAPYVLASSAQPCAMCVGALAWSGISTLLFGARRRDVQALAGFDEGPIAADWESQLAKRGIQVRGGILRQRAAAVLREYAASGGILY
jgi:tRNA(Arg) A34 adenosine deaminase TadA